MPWWLGAILCCGKFTRPGYPALEMVCDRCGSRSSFKSLYESTARTPTRVRYFEQRSVSVS